MAEKTFTGVYTDKETLARINAALPAANCRTRNEFINKAIHFYLTYLNNQSSSVIAYFVVINTGSYL